MTTTPPQATIWGQSLDPKGRDLDVQVAERALRWKINFEHGYGRYEASGFTRNDLTKVGHPPERCSRCADDGGCKVQHSVPRYSTDPYATLWLLSHMVTWSHAHNWEPGIHAQKDGRWQVSFMFGCTARGATLGEAVCRAALKVVL